IVDSDGDVWKTVERVVDPAGDGAPGSKFDKHSRAIIVSTPYEARKINLFDGYTGDIIRDSFLIEHDRCIIRRRVERYIGERAGKLVIVDAEKFVKFGFHRVVMND